MGYTQVMGNYVSRKSKELDLHTAPWVELNLSYRMFLVKNKA